MATPRLPLPVEVSLLRICAQGLVPATQQPDAVCAVTHLLAVQGQQVSALPHALIARTPTASGTDVAEAFEGGSLVRHRPMRGTVHITHVRDVHWMRIALQDRRPTYEKQCSRLGIDDDVISRAAGIARDAITHAGGAIRRADLFAAWKNSLPSSHLDDKDTNRWCQMLMYRCADAGVVVEGPKRGNEHLVIDATVLPAADSAESGFSVSEAASGDARVELARRYIRGHGPVLVEDFAWWTGLTKTEAARCLDAAAEADSAIGRYRVDEHRIVPTSAPGRAAQRRAVLYMRRDLPDLLSEHGDEARAMLFLPAFDELYVGYANRTCLTDTEGDRLICPARNGLFRPLLVHEGRLAAVRPTRGEIVWRDSPTPQLASQAQRAVEDSGRRCRR